jgi:hypothetical protein
MLQWNHNAKIAGIGNWKHQQSIFKGVLVFDATCSEQWISYHFGVSYFWMLELSQRSIIQGHRCLKTGNIVLYRLKLFLNVRVISK